MGDITANRKLRDCLFTDLFQNKKYLLRLYKTLHPEDVTANEDSLTNVTIKQVLTDGIYNDLGFMVDDRLIILVEAQSTWSINIVIRGLMYLVNSYQDYINDNKLNIYGRHGLKIPVPELYVIYTDYRGDKPDILSLSKDFFAGQKTCLDLEVKVIYLDESNSIINQYIMFCMVYGEQRQIYKNNSERAIKETIRICKDRNILKEYLLSREKEVFSMMFDLYDQETIMDRWKLEIENESMAKGRQEGIQEGIQKGLSSVVIFMNNKGFSVQDIVNNTGLPENEILFYINNKKSD